MCPKPFDVFSDVQQSCADTLWKFFTPKMFDSQLVCMVLHLKTFYSKSFDLIMRLNNLTVLSTVIIILYDNIVYYTFFYEYRFHMIYSIKSCSCIFNKLIGLFWKKRNCILKAFKKRPSSWNVPFLMKHGRFTQLFHYKHFLMSMWSMG